MTPVFYFFTYPGKDFDFFLGHHAWLDRVREIDPEACIRPQPSEISLPNNNMSMSVNSSQPLAAVALFN